MTVCLLATGGTIASVTEPGSGAVRPGIGPADLIASVPELGTAGQFRIEQVDHVNGWNINPPTMLKVAHRVQSALDDPDVVGAVVTHGTDTVEETAFLCDMTVDSEKPVVFACSMRSADELAADGPRNLRDATLLAQHEDARGLGAVLAVDDEVHAARWVRKLDSGRTSAFRSPAHGPVGVVRRGDIRIRARPTRSLVDLPAQFDVSVPVIQTYTGMEPCFIEAVTDATDAAGVVLEGTGLGNIPGSIMPAVERAIARGLPVVVATRAPSGGTEAVYGGPGGGASLRDVGVLSAGELSAAKARLLLMLLLAGHEPDVGASFAGATESLS
jgi:L-asparaginase